MRFGGRNWITQRGSQKLLCDIRVVHTFEKVKFTLSTSTKKKTTKTMKPSFRAETLKILEI